jgi:type I restriction enzyme S subunit
MAGRSLAFNQDLKSIRVREPSVIPRYVFRFLQASSADVLRHGTKAGVTVQSIFSGYLETLPLPIPPLAEQERIVRLLDEADALRRLRAQADQRTAQLIPALFHEMFGDPAANPMGWPQEKLGCLVSIEATLVDPRDERFADLPHIGPDRVERGTGKLLGCQSARQDQQISAKFLFDDRDVLYSKIRPNLRKAALAAGLGLCSADMYPIRPGPRMKRAFLWAFLLSHYFTDRAIELSARANMPKLNRTQLASITAPVPPIVLQDAFEARVTGILELESGQAVNRHRLEAGFRTMLHHAFTGDL